jgi:hypothetical protein
MADVVDMAAEIEAENIAAALRRTAAPFVLGARGVCRECEEEMPRLVGGRCGYCRDGRVPPLDRLDEPRAALPPVPVIPKEPVSMPESKSITFVATGAVLAEIKRRTANGTSNNRAALDLVEAAIAGAVSPPIAAAPTAEPVVGIDPTTLPPVALALIEHDFSFDALIASLLGTPAPSDVYDDLAAAVGRADAAERRAGLLEERVEAAEAKLAKMREALGL